MSLTVDELAKEMEGLVFGRENRTVREVAEALLPFIERHISAGQTPKPAELAAEYCRGRDDGWEAAEQKYRQPPKPAGAVPLPKRYSIAGDHVPAKWCRYDDAIRYGDAREAAGRAVAVPDGLAVAIINAVQEYENPRIPFVTKKDKATHRQQVAMLRNFAGSLIEDAAAPIPQQPAAEGAGSGISDGR